MRSIGILLLGFLLLAFESPFLHEASVSHYAPDLALCVVLYVGLTTGLASGMGVALLLGLLKDGFALSSPVGLHMEIAAVAFLVSFRLSRRLALRGPGPLMLIAMFFSMGASLLELLLSLVFDRTFGHGAGGPTVILVSMIPQALATAPFAPLVFWLLDKLDALTTRKGGDSVYLG